MNPDPARLTERASAKLNLGLRIAGRREDGYHQVDSVVAFTEFADTLEMFPGRPPGLDVDGPFGSRIPLSGDNLVLRAAEQFGAALGRPLPGRFHLNKHLPVAAGIGGGSADAAAALRLLARHWSVATNDARLAAVALRLGADVPVCLLSRRSHMSGIGEVVRPLPSEPSRPVVLANPGVELSTAQVFGLVAPHHVDAGTTAAMPAINDLTAPAIELVPQIRTVLAALAATRGCRATAMSGSGPTCFALYEDSADASDAAALLVREHPSWWVVSTRLLN